MRPTGRLHIGHYFGALKNWVALQSTYECFFFIADWHALTTDYANPSIIRQSNRDVLLDWLSVGLDPEKATLFLQSDVKEHAELQLLLGMITPISWLERVPSYKELKQELKNKDLSNFGFLGYPVLQTADIALYKAHKVPVGVDQVSHLELAREIVRRFNFLYKKEVLTEPQALLTETPKVLGLDRRKMSKSYDNSVYLSDDAKTVEKKVTAAITDPARLKKDDPGHPEVCLIFDYHKLFSTKETVKQVEADCRAGRIGCVQDKKAMADQINAFLDPIRKRRASFEKDDRLVAEILKQGARRARGIAEETLVQVREAMGL